MKWTTLSYIGMLTSSILATVLYLPSRYSPLVYDDKFAIIGNPVVTGALPSSQAWAMDFWGHNRVHSEASHKSFRPLITLWLRSDYHRWKSSSVGYHLTNIALHALNSALVVLTVFASMLHKITKISPSEHIRRIIIASAAGILFAVHPIHSEAVMFISSGRADLAAGSLTFITFIVYAFVRYWDEVNSMTFVVTWSLFTTLVAVMLKETAATLPLLLAAWDYFCFEKFCLSDMFRGQISDTRLRNALNRCLALVAVALFPSIMRLLINNGRPDTCRNIEFNPSGCSLSYARWPSIFWQWFECFIAIAFCWLQPITCAYNAVENYDLQKQEAGCFKSFLSIDWSGSSSPPIESILDVRLVILIMSGWCCMALGCVYFVAGKGTISCMIPSLLFGCIPFLLSSNILFTVGTARAERLLYIPSLGFCIWAANSSLSNFNRSRPYRAVAFLFLITLCSMTTLQRNADWASAEQLWYSAARSTHWRDVHALNLLATNQIKRGKFTSAIRTLRHVRDIPDPDKWGGPTLLALRTLAELLEGQLRNNQKRAGRKFAGHLGLRPAVDLTAQFDEERWSNIRAEADEIRRRERALASFLCGVDFRVNFCGSFAP